MQTFNPKRALFAALNSYDAHLSEIFVQQIGFDTSLI